MTDNIFAQPTDPAALNLAHAIALQESEKDGVPDYNAVGDNGTSHGAYQWQPGNFQAAATKYGLDPTDLSPTNQDKVAYAQVKDWKDQGLQPAQIASMWNSGSPDNWQNHSGTKTINGKQVSYDTPAYVQGVKAHYQTLIGAQPDATPAPDDTNAPTPPFKYTDVPTSPAEIAQKKNEITSSDATLQAASKDANSVGGFISNFGQSLATKLPVIGSASTLGTDIGQNLAAPFVEKTLTDSKVLTDSVKANLLKKINETEAAGGDATKLKQTYNLVYGDTLAPTTTDKDIVPSAFKTTGEQLGDVGNVALDALSAGTYGEAAKGAETGVLLTKEASAAARVAALKAGTTVAKDAVENTAVKGIGTAVSPEVGRIAEGASKPTGLFTAKGATNVAKGVGIGYAQDVTQGLSGNRGQDREGAAAFIPGANTVFGGALPAVTEAVQSGVNKFGTANAFGSTQKPIDNVTQGIIDSRKKQLNVLDGYKSVGNVVQKNADRGIDVKDIVANTDLLHGAVDKEGTIHTKGEGNAIDQLNQFIKPQEDVISANLKKEGVSLPLSVVKKKLTTAVDNSGLEGAALMRARNEVAADLKGYQVRANPDGTIPLSTIHNAKVDKYSNINFMTEPAKQKSAKAIAGALKTLVEDNTKSVSVKALNAELAQHYAVLGYLEKLDGKKVEGGRLGKYFAKTVGAMVGGHFGPLGALAGAETAGAIKGKQLSNVFGSKIGQNLEQSDAMKSAVFQGKSKPVPVSSELEFNRGTGSKPKLKPVVPQASRRVPVQSQPEFSYSRPARPAIPRLK